jgi:hypothetical protein
MLGELQQLRRAPLLESYTGPVLFEGLAAAQLMRALLPGNLSGTRPALGPNGRRAKGTRFAGKIGKPVLPPSISVEDDPTLRELGGVPLVGAYSLDDEGVPARKVLLVQRGKLKGFLMSRSPRKDFPHSNGHGRVGLVGEVRGRVGNLLVKARGKSRRQLRRMLLARARAAGEDVAMVVRQLEQPRGGRSVFFRALMGIGATGVPRPVLAYKVGSDGKETLVRGLEFAQVPVRALRQIIGVGRKPTVHNYTGAVGGIPLPGRMGIPRAVVSPDLLFQELELTRAKGKRRKLPLLPRPGRLQSHDEVSP